MTYLKELYSSNNRNRWLSYTAAIVFLILAWWLIAVLINKPALPPPVKAFAEFYNQIGQGLLFHAWVSLYRIVISLAIALVLGIPSGIILGQNQKIDSFIAPVVYLTYPIPKVVFLPVLIILMGYGDTSKVFLITLIVFYQVLVTTRDASRNIDPQLIMSVRSLGAVNRHLYWHVYFLGCLPEILTALRIALGTSIAVLFIAEAYATQEGLGFFIMDSLGRFDHTRMFAGIIAMGTLGFLLYILLDILEKVLCPWKFLNKQGHL